MRKRLWLAAAIVLLLTYGPANTQEILIHERIVGFSIFDGQPDFNSVVLEHIVSLRPTAYSASITTSIWLITEGRCRELHHQVVDAEDRNADGRFAFRHSGSVPAETQVLPVLAISELPLSLSDAPNVLERLVSEDEELGRMMDVQVVRTLAAAHMLQASPTAFVEIAYFDPATDEQRTKAYFVELNEEPRMSPLLTSATCP